MWPFKQSQTSLLCGCFFFKFTIISFVADRVIGALAMEGKDRVLILGATGKIGRWLVKASIALGHPTFVLCRPENVSNREKCQMFMEFKMKGAHILRVKVSNLLALMSPSSVS